MSGDTDWLLLVATLPTSQAAARMRLWRSLKTCGAATLKDGVYLLPEMAAARESFTSLSEEVVEAGGEAWLVRAAASADDTKAWRRLFDRSEEYRALIDEVRATDPADWPPAQGTRRMQALWRRHSQIVQTDHLPGAMQQRSQDALKALEAAWLRIASPGEPRAVERRIPRLDPALYTHRVWATRRRPWVDRLASAWLIRRHIDAQARFRWLADPQDCEPDWLGFDFDGAAFTHVGEFVTFETLLHSFGLAQSPALARMGALVRHLDVGGPPVPQAPGIEAALAGLRDHFDDDDQLLDAACAVFDGLHRSLDNDSRHKDSTAP